MTDRPKAHAMPRHFPIPLLLAALVALAALLAHGALPAIAQESASLTLRTNATTVAETAGSATVTVTLDPPAGEGGVTVTLLLDPSSPGSAARGRDYSLPEPLTVAEGDAMASFRITINDDAVNEPDETINLTATCECNAFTANVLTLTIQDNEQDVRDPVETHSYVAGNNPQNFRAEPAGSSIVVKFDESTFAPAWVRWREDSNPEWTTVKNVRSGHILDNLANGVQHHVGIIFADSVLRSDWASTTATPYPAGRPASNPNEMTLTVLGGGNAFGENVGIVTVLARVHGTAPEGGVTVTLDPLDGSPATAVVGSDYALPGSFTIAEGRSEAPVNISIIDDSDNEPDETILLSATTDAAAITSIAGLILTIRDDDPDLVRFRPDDAIADRYYTAGTEAEAQDAYAYYTVGPELEAQAQLDLNYTAGPGADAQEVIAALPEAVTETPSGASSVSVVYSATGLPAGLTLSGDRTIIGTPDAATDQPAEVVYTATATVINADGSQGPTYRASKTFTFRIFVNPPVAFSTETIESLRTRTVVYDLAQKKWLESGDDGEVTLPAAFGGTGGLTYGLYDDDRSRPLTDSAAVSFDSATRKIGGTPRSINDWTVTYWARDANGVTASATTTVSVRAGGL